MKITVIKLSLIHILSNNSAYPTAEPEEPENTDISGEDIFDATPAPTLAPTPDPTAFPTPDPTAKPTLAPTPMPTLAPTREPVINEPVYKPSIPSNNGLTVVDVYKRQRRRGAGKIYDQL